jgi:hypothetical protein
MITQFILYRPPPLSRIITREVSSRCSITRTIGYDLDCNCSYKRLCLLLSISGSHCHWLSNYHIAQYADWVNIQVDSENVE